jgi:hypothetical protein
VNNKTSGQKSKIVLSLLPLIESGRASLQIDALAADAIAACARFSLWVLTQKQAGGEWNDTVEENWLRMLDVYEEATLECQAAVRRFDDSGERGELADSLRRVTEKLNQRPDLARPIPKDSR